MYLSSLNLSSGEEKAETLQRAQTGVVTSHGNCGRPGTDQASLPLSPQPRSPSELTSSLTTIRLEATAGRALQDSLHLLDPDLQPALQDSLHLLHPDLQPVAVCLCSSNMLEGMLGCLS